MTLRRWLHLVLIASLVALGLFLSKRDSAEDDRRLLPQVVRDQLPDVRDVHVGAIRMTFLDGGWVLQSSGGYRVDGAMINRLLRGLSKAERREAKTNRPDGLSRLGLGPDQGKQLWLKAESGDVIYRLQVGNQDMRSDYGGFRSFVALGGRAWTVAHLPEISTDPMHWVDPLLWRMNTGRIAHLTVTDEGQKPFVLHRPLGDEYFSLKGNKSELNERANYLAGAPAFFSLRAIKAFDQDGLDLQRSLQWQTWDGLVVTVNLYQHEAGQIWISLKADVADPLAEKVEGLESSVEDEAHMLNARWNGFLFRLDDEKTDDLMVARSGLIGAIEP